ncbi:ABC transporter ATP-binding protein [Olsenella phocaeensis]|uniref:ABC transporter ATP-binding protein n=1 Tax=Olsenella phocaeensis TaxID=1852385 RepID=UPI000931923D|nr:ABC transporter ATP-binding protein [Olsenella phocaeensis]
MSVAVSFERFSFRYDGADSDALRDIDLQVHEGELMVLTGESGCGKTTLTRAMNGLIPLVYQGTMRGRVAIDDKPVTEWTTSDLAATVGSVFQNPRSQFVNSDVEAELAFGCENQGLPHATIAERVHESVRTFGIGHLLHSRVEELSGGQRQMVVLASVYATHPDVFVLDEPTAALDVPSMELLGQALARLKAMGKTVIVSEHRLWWLSDLADRVVVMRDGAIAGSWSAADFGALPWETRSGWGLRAWRVEEMDARASSPTSCEKVSATSVGDRWEEGRAALETRGLCVSYRHRRRVIDDCDLTIPAGTAIGLVGANGTGKTTLARCLCGIQREAAGTVELAGTALRPSRRAGSIYLVMQEPGYQLFEHTVARELEEAQRRGFDRDAPKAFSMESLMEDFGLAELVQRHPLSLSGGQGQRVSIAAGLLYGARALVMDEPTSGLDYRNMAVIARQVGRLKRHGLPICVITHDYEFLCSVCDAVVSLDGGRPSAPIPLNPETLGRIRRLLGFSSVH